MKILVTGGGGFLGGWVCRLLLARGDAVRSFQRSEAPELEAAGIEVIRGDLSQAEHVQAAAKDYDAVIHIAGKAGAWGDRDSYYQTNVTGTLNVIDACRRQGINKLVFTSSPSVTHAGGDIEGGDESLPYPAHFAAPYPETKALAEQAVMAASDGQLHTVSLRPHLVWGPGDNQLLPRLVERASAGTIRLPGAQKLIDTVYVENAARAHLLALDALADNPACHGRTYFITNGEPLPQAEIIGKLLDAAGVKADIRPTLPGLAMTVGAACEWVWKTFNKAGEPPLTRWSAEQLSTAHWYDISAAERDLGYQPLISLDEGLERLREFTAQPQD